MGFRSSSFTEYESFGRNSPTHRSLKTELRPRLRTRAMSVVFSESYRGSFKVYGPLSKGPFTGSIRDLGIGLWVFHLQD